MVGLTALATLFAGQANALVLQQGDTYYLGSVTPGLPSSDALEVQYINALLDLTAGNSLAGCVGTNDCSRLGSTLDTTGLPDATLPVSSGAVSTDIDVTGWTWLLAKYDADKGGDLVWYVGGLSGLLDVQATFGSCGNPSAPTGCGLSHYSLLNGDGREPPTTVPEPATLLLFAMGFAGLGLARRRRQV